VWSQPVGSRPLCELLAIRHTVILIEFGGRSVVQVSAVLHTHVARLSRNRSLHFPRNSLYNRIMEIVMERFCNNYNTPDAVYTSYQTFGINGA
jgi:hypothetical protein